jgi:integrase
VHVDSAAMGCRLRVVSERLGHSNSKMTLDTYQHVVPQMQRRAADAMEAFLFPSGEPERQCDSNRA